MYPWIIAPLCRKCLKLPPPSNNPPPHHPSRLPARVTHSGKLGGWSQEGVWSSTTDQWRFKLIQGMTSSEQYINNCLPERLAFPRIIAPFWWEKRNNRPRLYHSRKYGILHCLKKWKTIHFVITMYKKIASMLYFRDREQMLKLLTFSSNRGKLTDVS